MQTELVRPHLFNIRLSDDEHERMQRVAHHLGVNTANLIRMLVMEKARELGLAEPSVASKVRARAAELGGGPEHARPKKRGGR